MSHKQLLFIKEYSQNSATSFSTQLTLKQYKIIVRERRDSGAGSATEMESNFRRKQIFLNNAK